MADAGTRKTGRGDLTQGRIGPTLLAFALPTLGSSVLQSLNGSVNAIWVGNFLGEDALAATTNGNLVMFLLMAFVFGFGMAATILIGQAFGRRDIEAGRRVMGTSIGTFVALVSGISLLGWILAPQLLHLLATPGDAFGLALAYLRVIFVGMPPTLMLTMLMMALRGGGDSLTPLYFMLIDVVLDVGLNPVFILGLGPAPRLGISGSALATTIAAYTSLTAMIAYAYARDLPLRLRGRELRYLLPDRALLKIILVKGFPIGLQMIVICSSALAMLGLVNSHGVASTAAYGVTQQLWTYVQMPAMALGAAVSAMAAQNIGAGNWDRVSKITRIRRPLQSRSDRRAILLLTVADKAALGLFLGQDSAAMPIARHIQLVATWGFLFFGISLVLFGTVRANGEVIWPLIILFVAMYPVRLGFAFGARTGSASMHCGSASRRGWWRPRSWPPGSTCKAAGSAAGWRRCKAAPTRWNAANEAEAVREPRRRAQPGGLIVIPARSVSRPRSSQAGLLRFRANDAIGRA